MEITAIKENKLKAILMFSVPSIIAMLLQTTITITDGYFTGNYVGENALAAPFFSWLGVSMYLDRSAIESLLQNNASISANGSFLLFDYADAGLFHSEERRV